MARNEKGYIFPSEDINFSSRFELIENLGIVSISGLQDGDEVKVEIFIGTECDGEYVPFAPDCCGQQTMNGNQNQLFLSIPGRYRLEFSNINGNHLTDPSWFENVNAFYRIVESNVNLNQYTKGDSMGCGLSISDVKIIADGAIAEAGCQCVSELNSLDDRIVVLENKEDLRLTSTNTITNPDGSITIEYFDQNGDLMTTSVTSPPTQDIDFDDINRIDNPDGTVTIQYLDSDGNVITTDTVPNDVDFDDVVQTVNANGSVTLQFLDSDGNVIDVVNLPAPSQTTSSIVQNADGTITHGDGLGNTFTFEKDQSRVNMSAFIDSDYGLSAGQWNKNRAVPATFAELASGPAFEVSTTPYMLESLLTNRANPTEAALGARGVMDADGRVSTPIRLAAGADKAGFGAAVTNAVNSFQDSYIQVVDTEGGAVDLTGIPDGYAGQKLTIRTAISDANNPNDEFFLEFGSLPTGVARRTDHAISRIGAGGPTITGADINTIVMRNGETIELSAVGNGQWSIIGFNNWQFEGKAVGYSWRENLDGTVSLNMRANLGTNSGLVTDVLIPGLIVLNPEDLMVRVTDTNNWDTPADGDPLSNPNDAIWDFVSYRLSNTPISVAIGARNVTGSVNIAPAAVFVEIENIKIDYTQL